MKILAVFMIGIVLSFCYQGKISAMNQVPAKAMCCQKMSDKAPAKNHRSNGKENDCGKNGCPMMFSCSVCGFFTVQSLKIQPVIAGNLMKPVPLYKIGDLSAYYSSNWKPPKAC
jgi:hypothetical protein